MAGKIKAFLDAQEKQLNDLTLKVGFPKEVSYPEGRRVAEVAYMNEFGNPGNNQPPRPFFRNAISAHQKDWSTYLASSMRAGVNAKEAAELLGEKVVSNIKDSILTLTDPPLSETTLYVRKHRTHKPKNFTDKPLVDTHHMLESVKYWVVVDDESS
ncbi:hypothetical protein [Candidatus Arsenophonus triatominarum]|uniref:hypothetical protein n=1 Tax=Candidatus Arsenophonus triatominarum TaxID=57911 RepID=UPI0007C52CA0|nr:hypothetical protein [Candidatus Arsenophonus triatominarum]